MSAPKYRQPLGFAITLALLAIGAAFALLFLHSAMQPSGNATVRVLGRRLPVPWEQARWGFGIIGASLLLLLARSGVAAVRGHLAQPARPADDWPELGQGETVRLSGRLGWRSLRQEHAIVAAMIVPTPLPLLFALNWVMCGGPSQLGSTQGALFQFAMGGTFLLILGPLALGPLWSVLFKNNRWLHSIFGTLVVTDDRLLWRRAFDGRIAHEIDRSAVEDAVVVEHSGERGEVHLTVRVHKAKAEDQVLAGVPDPDGFVAALRRAA